MDGIRLLWALTLPACAACAAEYCVAPTGTGKGSGAKDSPWNLKKANAEAKPGDTVVLLDGNYNTPIAPANSGEEGKPIVYRAANRHQAVFVEVVAQGSEPEDNAAVNLCKRAYVTVDGIRAHDVSRFVVGNNARHVTIENCHFENKQAPQGWENLRFRFVGDGIVLRNNLFKNGTDLVRMYGGDRHLIEGNVFDTASHACLALIGIQRSVVRNNRLRNPTIKLMELQTSYKDKYAFEERPFQYNVIEGNRFEHTGSYKKQGSSSPGIFLAGRNIVVRRNVVTDCQIGAWFYTQGDKAEGWYCQGLRIYSNVFYANGRPGGFRNNGPGLGFTRSEGAKLWGDHVLANNAIFANKHFDGAHSKGLPETIQILFHSASPKDVRMYGNDILHEKPGEPVIALVEKREGGKTCSLRDYEKANPDAASDNIESAPQFADAKGGDFRLKAGSPCIDTGRPLTKAAEAGKGATVKVADATFFCDGFGLIEPDVLRVGAERVKAVKVDYEKNAVTLDREIAWEAGAPVTLDYSGKAPDIGAFEFEGK